MERRVSFLFMSKIVWKPGAVFAPVPPALVSCGDLEHPNLMTAAWTGIVNTHPPMTYVSIRPQRYSYELIMKNKEFAVNLTPASLIKAADFCGVRSGRDLDKWAACGLTPAAASEIAAPLVAECPLALECRVKEIIPLGSHHMFLAEIVALDVEETLISREGSLCIEKAGLAAYAHGKYFALGQQLGTFGFSVRKRKKKSKPAKGEKNKCPPKP